MSKTMKKIHVSTKVTKTRRTYTYAQKINILKQLENSNLSVLAFSKKSNIPVETLRNWKQSKNKILSCKKKTSKKIY